MDVKVVGSLLFLACGGFLCLLAILQAARVHRVRQAAVRTTGTVLKAWSEAIKSRALESLHRYNEPRRQVRKRTVHSHQTHMVTVAYEDATGKRYEATRVVAGRYAPGQHVALLFPANNPANMQLDSKLEAYGKACVLGVMGLLFMLMGVGVLTNAIPLAAP